MLLTETNEREIYLFWNANQYCTPDSLATIFNIDINDAFRIILQHPTNPHKLSTRALKKTVVQTQKRKAFLFWKERAGDVTLHDLAEIFGISYRQVHIAISERIGNQIINA